MLEHLKQTVKQGNDAKVLLKRFNCEQSENNAKQFKQNVKSRFEVNITQTRSSKTASTTPPSKELKVKRKHCTVSTDKMQAAVNLINEASSPADKKIAIPEAVYEL